MGRRQGAQRYNLRLGTEGLRQRHGPVAGARNFGKCAREINASRSAIYTRSNFGGPDVVITVWVHSDLVCHPSHKRKSRLFLDAIGLSKHKKAPGGRESNFIIEKRGDHTWAAAAKLTRLVPRSLVDQIPPRKSTMCQSKL